MSSNKIGLVQIYLHQEQKQTEQISKHTTCQNMSKNYKTPQTR